MRFRIAVGALGGILLVINAGLIVSQAAGAGGVRAVQALPTNTTTPLYTGNRAPLQPSPLIKLPIGSITPGGWIRQELELDAQGIPGKYEEVSDYLKYDGNGWVDPNGKAGWEELTYWMRGFGDLGYVLKDPAITQDAEHWINGVLTSQRPDGWFGPESARTSLDGGPDLWPHMPMLYAIRSYYDYTGDKRVIPFLTKFFQFENAQPPAVFNRGWGAVRWGDTMDIIYWLYNQTGDSWLLDLAKKINDNSADYTNGIPTWHNVNLSQGMREPAEYWQQSGDVKDLDATEKDYETVMGRYGQFSGGGFAGDENCRPGFGDPRQGFETCGFVESMHSFEMMTRMTGNPLWADRCEDIAINSLPATLSPDHKGIHYITCANLIQIDNESKTQGQYANGPFPMLAYMAGVHNYRCCPHNYGMGWPYYAENMWLATEDRGLCAVLYGASQVKAKVGNGAEVTLAEDTQYPFDDTIRLKLTTPETVDFPLYLRVPRWCHAASVKVNGAPQKVAARPLSYIVVDRTWKTGDTVDLTLPMEVSVKTWARNKGSVSVNYGPITFSVDIQEKWTKFGDYNNNPAWPSWAVYPESPWNYGLVLNGADPAKSFQVVRVKPEADAAVFTPAWASIELKVKAKSIPGWKADKDNVVGLLQPSPVLSDQPEQTITLIPMGAARLRITSFPTIGTGPDAHEWGVNDGPVASASHVFDALSALDSGDTPTSSYDQDMARFTWWDHLGTSEWVQYDYPKPITASAVSVYWYDDTGHGACRVPQSWKLLYKDGTDWKPVQNPSDYGVAKDKFNSVTFDKVTTTGLRIEVQLQPKVSGGILQWKVEK